MSYSKEELVRYRIRQQADYEDFADIQPEEIKPLLPKINDLIRDIEELIDEEDGI